MANNNQIDNTDYYRLPCGKYLEDFIAWRHLDFAFGSALKYLWRSGKKDGESALKDLNKMEHYIRFLAKRNNVPFQMWRDALSEEFELANNWKGDNQNG